MNCLLRGGCITDNGKLMYILFSVLCYFMIRLMQNTRMVKEQKTYSGFFVIICILVGLGVAIFALLQRYGIITSFNSRFAITGPFTHPAILGGFLSLSFVVCCSFCIGPNALYRRRLIGGFEWRHVGYIIGAILLSVIFLAKSRAALLAIFISFCFLYQERISFFAKRVLRKRRYILLLVLAAAAGCFVAYRLFSLRKQSVYGRVLVWKIATKMIAQKPLFGWGLNTFSDHYPDFQIDYYRSGVNTKRDGILADEVYSAFNEFIQMTIETGFFGLLCFLLILILLFFKRGPPANYLLAAKAGIVAWMVFSFFSYPFSTVDLTLYLFVFFALASSEAAFIESGSAYQKRMVIYHVVLAGMGILYVFCIPTSLLRLKAYGDWEGIVLLSDERARIAEYSQLVGALGNNDRFRYEYAHALLAADSSARSFEVLSGLHGKYFNSLLLKADCQIKLGDTSKAEYFVREARELLPNRLYPLYYLMKLNRNAHPSMAAGYARDILAFPVGNAYPENDFIRQQAILLLEKK